MPSITKNPRNAAFGITILFLAAFLFFPGCRKLKDEIRNQKVLHSFEQVNLVANNTSYHAARVDLLLLNPWGLSFSTGGTAWVSAEAAGLSTVYDKEGLQVRTPVGIPSPTTPTGGHPTGQVFNGSADFVLSNGQPARFIFVGDD